MNAYPTSATPGATYLVLCPKPRGNAAREPDAICRTDGGSWRVAPSGKPALLSHELSQDVTASTVVENLSKHFKEALNNREKMYDTIDPMYSRNICIESDTKVYRQGSTRWCVGMDQVTEDSDDLEAGYISSDESARGIDLAERIRVKPSRDIWTIEEIQYVLRQLPYAETISALVEDGLYEKVINLAAQPEERKTAALWACWLGRSSLLARLLKLGIDPNWADDAGRTCLHLSCLVGSEECVKLLLEHKADPNRWECRHEMKATPLHCAASAKSLACVKILLEHGADVNAGLNEHSPLHYAVLSDAPEVVSLLLQAGACPDTPQVFTETPLHVAASLGSAKCTKLLLDAGADVRAAFGTGRATALHLAAEDDVDGRTPLHGSIVRGARACDVARMLLSVGADPNAPDEFGYTPLHIAALNEFSACVLLLLDYGGDLTLRTNGGVSALSFVVRRVPDVVPRYLCKFDDAVHMSEHELGDVDCEFTIDFRPLVPCLTRGEAELLLAFIEVGRKDVLKHPVAETFLFLKWRRIRKFFVLSFIYHALFITLYSIYILQIYLCAEVTCDVPTYLRPVQYLIILLNLCFLCKEIFQACLDWSAYIRQWENWLQCIIIIGVFLCTAPNWEMDNGVIRSNTSGWQHDIAAVTIFFCWLELMMIIGRFPTFGLYVQMFTTVTVNFATFLLAYSCLLIAFGLAFSVLFSNYPAFQLPAGLVKTVMMMSGELEYEDIFYNNCTNSQIQYPLTAHGMFLIFVLLVTVILTNLLIPKELITSIYGMVASRKDTKRSIRKNNNYECRIKCKEEPGAPKPQLIKRKSNLFDRYSSESQQVERRKRTTSGSDNRNRPISMNISAIQEICMVDIKTQLTELTKKINKLVEVTDSRLNIIEKKLDMDPISKMPKPEYERKDKIITCQNSVDSSSNSSVYAVKVNTEKIKDFYRSIPDYNDINHLPAEEFYSTLKSLRQKKKVMLEFAVDQIDDSNSENTLVREDAYSNHNAVNDKSVKTVYNSSLRRKYSAEKKDASRDFCGATNLNRRSNIDTAQSSKNLTVSAMKQPQKKLTVSNLEVTIDDDPKMSTSKSSSMKEKNKTNKAKRNHSACSISWNDDKIETKNEVDQKFQKFFDGAEYSKLKKVYVDDEFKTQSMPSSPLRGKRSGSPPRRRKSITVPKPFKMTERDEDERAVNELRCLQKSFSEDMLHRKCDRKQFRTRPVPIESRIPLYDKILEDQAMRRAITKINSEAELRAKMKPFSFTEREESGIQKSCERAMNVLPKPKKKKKFRARPVPKNLFSNYFYDKMKEEEFFRPQRSTDRPVPWHPVRQFFRQAESPKSHGKEDPM
ncbi:hypothetical protein MSG28_006961 [Choristoneura fumiferana]|uniref:Uncharacterized protein n=1 Tax=Choristoneura fumiferana TaxID=7141 RepID=A0ACC0JM30_CHOFU|nr:hypothetical protein MSG28_006961 [Choristoneura fumiferana]